MLRLKARAPVEGSADSGDADCNLGNARFEFLVLPFPTRLLDPHTFVNRNGYGIEFFTRVIVKREIFKNESAWAHAESKAVVQACRRGCAKKVVERARYDGAQD